MTQKREVSAGAHRRPCTPVRVAKQKIALERKLAVDTAEDGEQAAALKVRLCAMQLFAGMPGRWQRCCSR